MVAYGYREWEWGLIAQWYEVLIWSDENVLELDRAGGCFCFSL